MHCSMYFTSSVYIKLKWFLLCVECCGITSSMVFWAMQVTNEESAGLFPRAICPRVWCHHMVVPHRKFPPQLFSAPWTIHYSLEAWCEKAGNRSVPIEGSLPQYVWGHDWIHLDSRGMKTYPALGIGFKRFILWCNLLKFMLAERSGVSTMFTVSLACSTRAIGMGQIARVLGVS